MEEKVKVTSFEGLTAKEILNWVNSCLEHQRRYTGVAYQNVILVLPVK
jgi:hypothetical protein